MSRADGILFDKDGTLFDFHATWSVWAHGVIHELATGDPAVMDRLAQDITIWTRADFDPPARSSPAPIARPPSVWAAPCRGARSKRSRII